MARTVAIIEQQIKDKIAASPKIAAIVTNPSQVSNWQTFINCIAICIAVFEQIIDVFKSDTETTVRNAPVGNDAWIQAKVLEYQDGDVLQLVNFAPQYVPIDPAKRIVSRAAVRTLPNNVVQVKFAVSDPPVAASAPQIAAIQSYLTQGGDGTYSGRAASLGFAGVDVVVISQNADKLYLAGTIFYNGQFSATIENDVILALGNYLQSISTQQSDGVVSLLGITDAIQGVGVAVTNISLTDVAVRADVAAFTDKVYLRQNKTDNIISYPTYAGYIVEETTAGEGWTNKLNFVASS